MLYSLVKQETLPKARKCVLLLLVKKNKGNGYGGGGGVARRIVPCIEFPHMHGFCTHGGGGENRTLRGMGGCLYCVK